MQLNRNRHPFDKISYYQGNCECDFVMQREENIMQLIQVTWSMADDETREREIKGLLEASSITGCNNLLIITNDEEGELVKDGKTIKIMPAWKWLTKGDPMSCSRLILLYSCAPMCWRSSHMTTQRMIR